ncbi:MAG: hypothetical protein LBK54_00835 [Propionibacteriaceae bacterium]|nr:hypothetical protein [Propionibacteriaceae bacterium]
MTAPEYVAARRVLLDALGALHDHLGNLILVGAQAVYLHAGTGALNVPPMTTDADLALNTQRLAGSPEIARTLLEAGFSPSANPGHWLRQPWSLARCVGCGCRHHGRSSPGRNHVQERESRPYPLASAATKPSRNPLDLRLKASRSSGPKAPVWMVFCHDWRPMRCLVIRPSRQPSSLWPAR